ncbi:hypothetical protein AUH73_06950 [archaeon 13_1_40CM_4_53_4]|nr:MAG: hypothetical protein AUH73_06950 [archaeon 13_1_40CM_4_53_4]OLD55105.1 MAG: hypothetical protein AUI46_06105 [archaeon 13_1_40CM_2_52_13]TMI40626.1 MAG: hypothetical protein E6H21_05820 [Candidatus Bathyarchaeota archaeon]
MGQYSVGSDFIRLNKDVAWEETNHGKTCEELWEKEHRILPCAWTIGAFSKTEVPVRHVHPFISTAKKKLEEFPAYSVGTWSYDQMYDMDTRKLQEFEDREANIKEFFDSFEPGKSLVFLYLNFDNPLNSENKKYVLVGIARLVKLGPYNEFEGLNEWQTERYGNRIWSRYVVHDYPREGVRIPYQEYVRLGRPVEPILVEVEGELDRRFKYVARQLADDDACELIERTIASIDRVDKDGFVPGDWKRSLDWLNRVLAETWRNRGPYPGLGSVIEALGVRGGTGIFRKLIQEKHGVNLRDYVFDCLNGKEKAEWALKAQKLWNQYRDSPKGKLLRVLASFDLETDQIEKIVGEKSKDTGITSSLPKILDNPYILCEEYQGENEDDVIGFFKIDNGIFPDQNLEPAIEMEVDDPRRIRALMIDRLRAEENTGNCFLDTNEVLSYVEESRVGTRKFRATLDHVLADKEFYTSENKLSFLDHEGHHFVYLRDVKEEEGLIRERIEKLLERAYSESKEDWKAKLQREHPNIPEEVYSRVLTDQAQAVETCYENRLSVITGAAGTGKTTVIRTLIEAIKKKAPGTTFALLTPTGKARERLHQATGMPAKTIHRFLMENSWLAKYTYRYVDGKKVQAKNIIIDEASMVDLRLMAHLFRAIDWNYVERFVLVGDRNQLPPIGFGRPFYDIVSFLEGSEHADRVSSLRVNCRQMVEQSTVLSLASIYVEDKPENFEEILNKVERGERFKDLDVVFWNDEKDLQKHLEKKIEEVFASEKFNGPDESENFNQMFNIKFGQVGEPKHSVYGIEYLQILSPYRGEYFGTSAINIQLQKKYRKKSLQWSLEGLATGDKVIQVINTTIHQHKLEYELFNGQLGYIKFVKVRDKPQSVLVDFKLDGKDEAIWVPKQKIGQNLELGYCISVHKAQGSEFDIVFLILPREKLGLISRELLYTGLTRSKRRLVLFLQENIAPLLHAMNLANSAILLRNTSIFKFRFISEKYRANDLIHRTDRLDKAEYVRSKSEVIIANELLRHNISYEYEQQLYAKDHSDWVLPDFTIQYEGDTWYWEHLGRLKDPEYVAQWERKMQWYARNGYDSRLVITEEVKGFDSPKIVQIIKERFA